MEILVKSPNLDIAGATGEIRRFGEGNRKVIGARVEPGIKRSSGGSSEAGLSWNRYRSF